MAFNLVNQVGEWNPQLFREIKGRLKPRNILIAVTVSLFGQMLLLMSFASQLPVTEKVIDAGKAVINNHYCLGKKTGRYTLPICELDSFGNVFINWQLWWQSVFIGLSILGMVALLIVGTYMLISDLSKEEQKGTLNFLRLTPQSSRSLLIGKMLGVPIILYLVGLVAFPLHLVAGLSGGINLAMILGVYSIIAASCLFFYSVALLFGLTSSWLGGFHAWLGSGAVLMYVWITGTAASIGTAATQTPIDATLLFNPLNWLTYLTGTNSLNSVPDYAGQGFSLLKVFGITVGQNEWSMLALILLNYGLWTYWAWLGLKRTFHNPKSTLFSKQQSYWLMACFQVVMLGFAMNLSRSNYNSGDYSTGLWQNFQFLMVFNLVLFLGFIAALSPNRQSMQDWARYRHQQRQARKRSIVADLIWAEKSPAIVAIALNVAIASSMIFTWLMLGSFGQYTKFTKYTMPAIFGLVLTMSLILVYAAVVQLILLLKLPKRASWAAVSVGILVFVPPSVFSLLSRYPTQQPEVWLFSALPWLGVEEASASAVLFAAITQSLATVLLSLQLTKQLRKAGESSTKALLSGRSAVTAD
jgi:hypothetical protein